MENNELYHYGVKGMKWGVRKEYIKSTGRNFKKKASQLYADIKKKVKTRREAERALKREQEIMKKPIKKLSTEELKERARILEARKTVLGLEKNVKDLSNDSLNAGKAFMKDFAKNALGAAVIGAGKTVATDYLTKIGKDALGLKEDDSMSKLKKEAELWKLKGQVAEGKKKDKEWKEAQNKNSKSDDDAKPSSGGDAKSKPSDNDSKSDSTAKSSPKSDSKANGDSNKQSAENSTKSKESNSSSTNKSDEDKVYTGDVVGEGTSKRQENKSKTHVDVDVDLSDTGLSTVRENTSLVSTGSQYIQYLLEDKSR